MNSRRVLYVVAAMLTAAGCEAIFSSSFNCNTDADCPEQSQGQRCVQNRCVGGSTLGDGSQNNPDGGGGQDSGIPPDAGGSAVDSGPSATFACSIPTPPLKCGTLQEALFVQYTLTDVGIASLGSGSWLVGTTSYADETLLRVTAGAAGTITVVDAGFMGDTGHGAPVIATALVAQPLSTPALLSGYFSSGSGGNFTSDLGCWSPLNAATMAAGTPTVDYTTLNTNEVDFIRAAVDGSGKVAFIWNDLSSPADFIAQGISSGTCPVVTSLAPLSLGMGTPFAASIQGLSPSGYVVAQASSYNPTNQISIAVLPDGGVGTGSFGGGANQTIHVPAVASDGNIVTALTSDNSVGVQLFQVQQNSLSSIGAGTTIFPPMAGSLAAASCGASCTLATWHTYATTTAGPQVFYAVINNQGCGFSGQLTFANDPTAAIVDMAVSYDVGTKTALIVLAYNTSTSANVMASVCQ